MYIYWGNNCLYLVFYVCLHRDYQTTSNSLVLCEGNAFFYLASFNWDEPTLIRCFCRKSAFLNVFALGFSTSYRKDVDIDILDQKIGEQTARNKKCKESPMKHSAKRKNSQFQHWLKPLLLPWKRQTVTPWAQLREGERGGGGGGGYMLKYGGEDTMLSVTTTK